LVKVHTLITPEVLVHIRRLVRVQVGAQIATPVTADIAAKVAVQQRPIAHLLVQPDVVFDGHAAGLSNLLATERRGNEAGAGGGLRRGPDAREDVCLSVLGPREGFVIGFDALLFGFALALLCFGDIVVFDASSRSGIQPATASATATAATRVKR
jgi:hypothetical protein